MVIKFYGLLCCAKADIEEEHLYNDKDRVSVGTTGNFNIPFTYNVFKTMGLQQIWTENPQFFYNIKWKLHRPRLINIHWRERGKNIKTGIMTSFRLSWNKLLICKVSLKRLISWYTLHHDIIAVILSFWHKLSMLSHFQMCLFLRKQVKH